MSYNIRQLQETDVERIAELEQLCYPPEMAVGKGGFAHMFRTGRAQEMSFGIESDGILVAYILPVRFHDRRFGDRFHWMDVAVHPDHQRKGLGKQLIVASLKACHPTGLPITADCRIGSYSLVANNPELLARAGYRIQFTRPLSKYFPTGEDGWAIALEAFDEKI